MDGWIDVFSHINYLAIVVCTAIAMVLGSLWFSPILFGNSWMKGAGLKQKDVQKSDSTKAMITSTINSFVINLVLAICIYISQPSGFTSGMGMGALISIGLISPILLTILVYEKKKSGLWMIYSGYYIIQFIINGGILAIWK